MRRFGVNRWWTLILALVLSVVSVASMPAAGYADKGGADGIIGGNDLGTDPPNPQGSGDPDMPSGNGRPALLRGGVELYGSAGTVGVGDTAVKGNAPYWMKVRLALSALKLFYLRY